MLMQPRLIQDAEAPTGIGLASRVRQSWGLIVAAFVIIGVLGSAFAVLRAPRYTSTALLLLDRTLAEDPSAKINWESKVDTEVEMLRAMAIVDLVARRVNEADLKNEARTGTGPQKALMTPSGGQNGRPDLIEFQRQFRITRRGMTDVIAIEATAADAERAAMLANTYAQVYLDEQVALRLSAMQALEASLRQRIATLSAELSKRAGQLELRRQLDDTIARLASVAKDEQLVQSDLRLAAPALPIDKEAFPSRKVLALLAWLSAGVAAVAVAFYRVRDYFLEGVQYRKRHLK